MRIVSIDSSLASALALIELSDGVATTVRQQVGTDARHHAESLAPMLSQVLAGEAVDAIAVATGPAPFTGLRAGLVTARTFARVHNLPLWGVSSLDARARAAFDRLGQAGQGKCLLVANDARRKEVYAARYQVKGADDVERLGQLHVLSPAAAMVKLTAKTRSWSSWHVSPGAATSKGLTNPPSRCTCVTLTCRCPRLLSELFDAHFASARNA